MSRRIAFVAALAALILAVPAVADAAFSGKASRSQQVSTDTMAPPTAVGITCAGNTDVVKWTATTTIYATGYTIYKLYNNVQTTFAVSGRSTTSYTLTRNLPAGSVVTITSSYANWSSAPSVSATAGSTCR